MLIFEHSIAGRKGAPQSPKEKASMDGIPATLQRLFDGRNSGKQMLKLADPE